MKPSNVLKIESLNDEWRDKDSVLLHACFQLLKDCVEDEHLFDGDIDWNAFEKHRKVRVEIEALYSWWLKRSKMDEQLRSDDQQEEEDNRMLHRLIDVRWALWT